MRSSLQSIGMSFVVAFTAAVPSTQAGITSGAYLPSLNTLPQQQGWSSVDEGGNGTPTVVGGTLNQGPTAYRRRQYWARNDLATDLSFDPVFISFTIKVNSSTYFENAAADNWRTGWDLFYVDRFGGAIGVGLAGSSNPNEPSGVRIHVGSDLSDPLSSEFVPFDTTSDFRTYTLISLPGVLALFADTQNTPSWDDDELLTFVPSDGLYTDPVGQAPPGYFYFGDGTSAGASETQLTSLTWGIVPAPSSVAALALGGVLAARRRRR